MKYFLIALLIFKSETSTAFDKTGAWKSLKEGLYTKKINDLSDQWSKTSSKINVTEKNNELDLFGIPTAGDKTYVGVMAKTLVNAKLSDLLKILRDTDAYQSIYPGLDEIKSIKSQDDFDIQWKFSGPMGTHTIYNTVQRVTQIAPAKGLLVYQLKKSDDVVETDGFIFLQEQGDSTKYLSVDFFNAKWGLAGTFFKDKIWETSFDNTKIATLAIKKLAEKSRDPSSGFSSEKVLANYIGLDDREKQKTFENLGSEIFDADKNIQSNNP